MPTVLASPAPAGYHHVALTAVAANAQLTNDMYIAWEAYTSMDFTPVLLLLGVVLFWFVVFVFSIVFFRRALRVPTEAELELAEEHKHSPNAPTAVEQSVRPSVAR